MEYYTELETSTTKGESLTSVGRLRSLMEEADRTLLTVYVDSHGHVFPEDKIPSDAAILYTLSFNDDIVDKGLNVRRMGDRYPVHSTVRNWKGTWNRDGKRVYDIIVTVGDRKISSVTVLTREAKRQVELQKAKARREGTLPLSRGHRRMGNRGHRY